MYLSKSEPCEICANHAIRKNSDISKNYRPIITNNNNLILLDGKSAIREFYNDGKVLITGSTGFVGKALVEKLLRTCRDLTKIYCLVRPKREQTVEERYKDLFMSSVFDRIRSEEDGEKLLSKIIFIPGDITEPSLGISYDHMRTLLADVTVVFHSAATVRFNETLETAALLNTVGTHRVVLFCRQMKQLKALIHVSTAYSNADKEEIGETVYPIPENIGRDMYPNDVLPSELLKKVGEKMKKNHPNTYTTSKAMAEWVVAEYADNIPTAIVRPSIVTAAWKEPFEGWVDNISGVTGIMMGIGQGIIRSIICDQRLVVDIIPVDIVVNTLIVSAWHVSVCRSNAIQVYNCTSGTLNPLSFEELGAITQRYSLNWPSKHVRWYPGFTFRTNRFMHLISEMMFHFFPAFLTDTALSLSGSKPIMLKIMKRFKIMAKTSEFFALHQWNFASENLLRLQEAMEHPYDCEVFSVDINELNWDSYIKKYILGIRKYILKDSIETIPIAKKKLQRLYWSHKALQVMTVAMIFKLIRT